MAITGLAYVQNAYGHEGLGAAAFYVGALTVLYNILAVITLTRSLGGQSGLKPIVLGISKNPLILAIAAALPFTLLQINLPPLLLTTGSYFANLTLPLALLCTGASLNLTALRGGMAITGYATFIRLAVIPLLFTLGGWWLDASPTEIGILFLISATPTAAASYVMTRAMGGDSTLAANIIATTTLGSLLTTSFGIALLNYGGLMG
jgi:predicted permease